MIPGTEKPSDALPDLVPFGPSRSLFLFQGANFTPLERNDAGGEETTPATAAQPSQAVRIFTQSENADREDSREKRAAAG